MRLPRGRQRGLAAITRSRILLQDKERVRGGDDPSVMKPTFERGVEGDAEEGTIFSLEEDLKEEK
jgi:hypothetical protein